MHRASLRPWVSVAIGPVAWALAASAAAAPEEPAATAAATSTAAAVAPAAAATQAPPAVERKPFFSRPIQIVAHRGGAGLRPENTLIAFKSVAETWPEAVIEVDARLSKDGVVVLVHDETVDRTTAGTGAVSALTGAELKQLDAGFRFSTDGGTTYPYRGRQGTIPTLDEVLRELPAARFEIELKEGARLGDAVLASIAAAKAEDRVLLATQNEALLARVREKAPRIATCMGESEALDAIERAKTGRWDGFRPAGDLLCAPVERVAQVGLTAAHVAALRDRGVPMQVYTVDDSGTIREQLDLGIASIVSDRPDLVAERLSAAKAASVAKAAATPAKPLGELGSVVVLGDSISDPPAGAKAYHDYLAHDLAKKYGHEVVVHDVSRGGARSRDLAAQLRKVPRSLPGPVAVFVTIGGNDMRESTPLVLLDADAAARRTLTENVGEMLDEVLETGRFGDGVEARVYVADVYDPSDGTGAFSEHKCSVPITRRDTVPMFGRWNAAIAEAVVPRGQTVVGAHARFTGRGFGAEETWYLADCIHPNEAGQMELRALFYEAVTGEPVPKWEDPEANLAMPVGKGLKEGLWEFTLRTGTTFKARNYVDRGDFVEVKRAGLTVQIQKSELESIKPTR